MSIGNIVDSLSAQLARMDPRQRQSFASIHKDNVFVVSLAKFINDTEQAKAQALQQGQQGQKPPPPKVNDTVVASLNPQPQQPQQALPEQQGIGALPAPNMQRMADGGIAGYPEESEFDFVQRSEPVVRMARGGASGSNFFDDAFKTVLGFEGTAYVEDDAGKGPTKFGINSAANPDIDVKNLTLDEAKNIYKKRYWDAIGGDALAEKNPALAKAAFDTAVNMGVSRANNLLAASGGDANKLLDLRADAYKGLVERDPKRFAPFAQGWQKRVDTLRGELPTATAAAAAPRAEIPGQAPGVTAPAATTSAATPPKSGRLAEFGQGLASLADVALSPVPWAVKQAGYAASRPFLSPEQAEKLSSETAAPFQDIIGKTFGVTGTPGYQNEGARRFTTFVSDNINKGSAWIAQQLGIPETDAINMMNSVIAGAPKAVSGARAIPSAIDSGLAKLTADKSKMTPQQIAQASADARLAQKESAVRQAMEAGATLDEQTALASMIEKRQLSEMPSAAFELQQKTATTPPGRIATGSGKVAERVKSTEMLSGDRTGAPALPPLETTPRIDPSDYSNEGRNYPKPIKRDEVKPPSVADIKKEATPEVKKQAKQEGWTNDDWLTFGFALLSSKSPHFSQALGEAGLGALAGQKARRKQEAELAKEESESLYRERLGKKAEAEAAYYTEGTKGGAAAMQAANKAYADWAKGLSTIEEMQMTDEKRRAKYQEFLRVAYAGLGLKVPDALSSSAAGATPPLPQGVTVTPF